MFDESPIMGRHRRHRSLLDSATADLRKKVMLLLFASHPDAPPILSRFAAVCAPECFAHIPLLWPDPALDLCGRLSAVKASVLEERSEVAVMHKASRPRKSLRPSLHSHDSWPI